MAAMSSPTTEQVSALATRFMELLQQGKLDDMAELYAKDAKTIHWFGDHNGEARDTAALAASMKPLIGMLGAPKFFEINRLCTPQGFVEEHFSQFSWGQGAEAESHRFRICFVADVNADCKITQVREFADDAGRSKMQAALGKYLAAQKAKGVAPVPGASDGKLNDAPMPSEEKAPTLDEVTTLASKFFALVEQGQLDEAAALYEPDATTTYYFGDQSGVAQSAAALSKHMKGLLAAVGGKPPQFRNARRMVTRTGFAEEHDSEFSFGGETHRFNICFVADVSPNCKIARVREYANHALRDKMREALGKFLQAKAAGAGASGAQSNPTAIKVFVTGGSGYIGSHVCKAFVARGHSVTGLVRSEEKGAALRSMGVTPVVGRLQDLHKMEDTILKHDLIVHTGADYSDMQGADTALVDLVMRLSKKKPKLAAIYTSGVLVTGAQPAGSTVTESTDIQTPEALRWRRSNEDKWLSCGSKSAVIRPAYVWGNKGGHLVRNGVVTLVGEGGRFPWIHADDLASQYTALGCALSATGVHGGMYHGVDGRPSFKMSSVLEALSKELGKDMVKVSVEEAQKHMGAFAQLGQLQQGDFSVAKLNALGWKPAFGTPVQGASEWAKAARA